jgi:hypothetical protein
MVGAVEGVDDPAVFMGEFADGDAGVGGARVLFDVKHYLKTEVIAENHFGNDGLYHRGVGDTKNGLIFVVAQEMIENRLRSLVQLFESLFLTIKLNQVFPVLDGFVDCFRDKASSLLCSLIRAGVDDIDFDVGQPLGDGLRLLPSFF